MTTTLTSDTSVTDVGVVDGPTPTWLRLIVGSLCQALLAMVVFLALWAAVPAAIGWEPTTVSSGSMLPRLLVGDVAVAKPLAGPPSLEQVLLFDDPDHAGLLRLHRFVKVDDEGRMITRGDANNADDSSPITPAVVHGVAVLRVPYVGLPIIWLRTGELAKVGLVAAALVLLSVGAGLSRSSASATTATPKPATPKLPAGEASVSTPATASRRLGTRRVRTAAALLIGLALLAGLAITFAAPSFARFGDAATTPTSRLAAADYFSCRNAVLANDPYLYYPLNETSGSVAYDLSGNGRNGAVQGTRSVGTSNVCTTEPTGSKTNALTLNGSTGYVATPTLLLAPNTFTVSTWFKTTSTRGGKLIGFGNARTGASTSVDRHVYLTNAGRLVFGVQPLTRQTVSSTEAYNDGAWHLMTATLSSAGMRLYVDGDLAASSSSVTWGAINVGYWRIGYDTLTGWPSAPTSNYFAGSMEQAAVFPSALSDDDIAALYAAGR